MVLLVEVTNRSRTSTFAPLDLAIVREPLSSLDQSFIELSRRRRIAMFRLAIESEWSIQDQVFPALKPGESVETILVSEPVAMSDLAGTMTWHVKLRTAPYRTDVLGVRFTRTRSRMRASEVSGSMGTRMRTLGSRGGGRSPLRRGQVGAPAM